MLETCLIDVPFLIVLFQIRTATISCSVVARLVVRGQCCQESMRCGQSVC